MNKKTTINILTDIVKSLPNDEEVKAHTDTLPYYGSCTCEYNEGFEDGVKWIKEQMLSETMFKLLTKKL
jgi:hypothetical protein